MGQHDIGEYFKNRIGGYSRDIDTEEVWRNLDLKETKKSRKMIFLLLGLLIFGILGILFWNSFSDKNSAPLKSRPGEVSEKITTDAKTIDSNKSVINNIEDSTPNVIYNQILKSENANVDVSSLISHNSLSRSKDELQAFTNFSHLIHTQNQNALSSGDIKLDSTSDDKTITSKTINVSGNEKVFIASLNDKVYINNEIINESYLLQKVKKLKSIPVSEINYKRSIYLDLFSDIPIDPVIMQHTNEASLELKVYSGYFGFNKSLKSLSTEISPHLFNRTLSETPLEMISIGSSLNYKLSNGVFFELGIEYQSFNDRFDFESSLIDTIAEEGHILSLIVDSNSDTTTMIGTRTSIYTRDETWKSYNSHRQFTIPISIGYELVLNKWSIYTQGSFLLSIDRFDGERLSVDGTITSTPDYYRSTLKFGYRLSGGLSYRLSERTALHAEPTYQSSISSYTQKSTGYTEGRKAYGLHLGLSLKL